MTIKQVAGYVFLFASAASAYVPEMLTRGSVKLTGGEFAEKYPERAWIRYIYPFLYLSIFFGAAILFFVSFTRSELLIFTNENWLYVVGAVLGTIPLFNGLFTLLTGVIPVNRRRQYLYVVDEEIHHQVGFILLAIGVAIIMAAAMAVLFWK